MRILFISHYFFPEGNAPATRVYEMTRRWANAGHEVTVVTCAPNVPNGVVYEGYRNALHQRELVDGVEVHRVWTYLAANKGTTLRIVSYVSFRLSALVAGLLLRRPDLVIATSPQFFCGWAGVLVTWLRRLPFVLEVRDLWPESIVAVGAMANSPVIRMLEWLERRMYGAATRIVTVGEGYREKLQARGVADERISVIPNGVDTDTFHEREDDGRVRAEFGLGDRFVCSYVGTIGMASGLSVVLEVARRLAAEGRDDVRFLLVGDGAIRAELEETARMEGLGGVVFAGRQPKERMPEFLAASDACLIHLSRTELFRTVLPSKIFEACAMKRPIILGVEGFAAELVGGEGAGLCIRPEDADALHAAVDRLIREPGLGKRLGEAGHERIAARFEYGRLAREYATLLAGMVAPGRSV